MIAKNEMIAVKDPEGKSISVFAPVCMGDFVISCAHDIFAVNTHSGNYEQPYSWRLKMILNLISRDDAPTKSSNSPGSTSHPGLEGS